MPTIRGWAALGAALALLVLWFGFGEELLLAVAAFLLLAVGVGVVRVRRTPQVACIGEAAPHRSTTASGAIVEIAMSSRRRTSTSMSRTWSTASARPGSLPNRRHRVPVVARYEMLCRPRGVYRVGPATISVRDPLAMAESGGIAGQADRLVVYPPSRNSRDCPSSAARTPR